MDLVLLSRLQFAVATCFHFLFVPLTLGLSFFVAIVETLYVRTGNEEYKKMARFWGKLLTINFAIGIATGLTLEFQFGTNWAGFSAYVGDIFGSLLAIEASIAFLLESTFLGIWIFGWNRVSPKFHAASIWVVALASNFSAWWIMVANSWMQHPVGYTIVNGRAQLVDFWAVITQPFAILAFLHTVCSGYILASFFVLAITSYHLLKKNHVEAFSKIFKAAAIFALIVTTSEVVIGDFQGKEVAATQKTKVAALESHWETKAGASFHVLLFPDVDNERNYFEMFEVPKFLSWLLYSDSNAEVKGLKDFPKELRPPVVPVFLAFRAMVGLGFLFVFIAFLAWLKRKDPVGSPWLLKVLLYILPLPYITPILGWIVTEVGRQPWVAWGLLKTSDAVSRISTPQVAVSLAGFIILYTLLGIANFYLLMVYAKRGLGPAK